MSQLKNEEYVANHLSDAKELFQWYKLRIPEVEKLEPRVGHAIVSHKPGEILMIGGGNHDGALQELLNINFNNTESSERITVITEHPAKQFFPAKYEFSCTKDNEQNVWMFGGADVKNTSNEVFKIDEENITEIIIRTKSPTKQKPTEGRPCPRTQGSNSALVHWKGKPYLSVFAGGLQGKEAVSDRNLYLFDINNHTWQTLTVKEDKALANVFPFGCQPPAVQGHAMTAIGSKIFVHGGINDLTLYGGFHWIDLDIENEDSTYLWKDSELEMPDAPKPPPRAAHGIARVADADTSSPVVYIFGGLAEKAPCNDLWSLDAESKIWTEICKNQDFTSKMCPEPRFDLGMCTVALPERDSDTLNVYLFIHGGMNSKGELFNDTWIMKVR